MHGRPRKPPKSNDEDASLANAKELQALQSQFFSNHEHKIYNKEAMGVSSRLIEINPEMPTAWNYRKLALDYNLNQPKLDLDSKKSIVDEELRLVEMALRMNFKSYGAWFHRKWVLGKSKLPAEKELLLLEKFQNVDARNFHAWNYRRFVTSLTNRSEEEELKYTNKLIDVDISNYSAWHNRSVLLSNLMARKVDGFCLQEVLAKEYELVRRAIFTDEDDQSGWFYHHWLFNETVRVVSPHVVSSWPPHDASLILDGHASFPYGKCSWGRRKFPIVLFFSEAVAELSSSMVTISYEFNNANGDVAWVPVSASKAVAAQVWMAHVDFPTSEFHSIAYKVDVTLRHSQAILKTSFRCPQPFRLSFTVRLRPVPSDPFRGSCSFEKKISMEDENSSDFRLPISPEPNHRRCLCGCVSGNHAWQADILATEIAYFRDLSACKIGKLVLARLLTALGELLPSEKTHLSEALQLYSDLMKLDPSHYHYYKDHRSLISLKQITRDEKSLLHRCFNHEGLTSSISPHPICLRLNNLSLSRMGSFENLLWVQMLDLSHNDLRSIEGLEAMQLLSYLNLSGNKIKSFTSLVPLRKLESLKALDVSNNEIGAHSIDTTKYAYPTSPCSPGDDFIYDEMMKHDDDGLVDYWEAFVTLKDLNLVQLDVAGNAIAGDHFTSFLIKLLPNLQWMDGVNCHHCLLSTQYE